MRDHHVIGLPSENPLTACFLGRLGTRNWSNCCAVDWQPELPSQTGRPCATVGARGTTNVVFHPPRSTVNAGYMTSNHQKDLFQAVDSLDLKITAEFLMSAEVQRFTESV